MKWMYKAIFFDVDDTLLNFGASGQRALIKAFDGFEMPLDTLTYNRYKRINDQLWAQQKQGLVSVQNVLDTRFQMLFDELGLDIDSVQFRDVYQAHLSQEHVLEEGALEAVAYLSGKYRLYVASNSVLAMQASRLKLANLLPHFADLFVSSDIGYEKPNPHFFAACLQRSQLRHDEVLFVGDSLEADMHGAIASNMATCWYNPHQQQNVSQLPVAHQISHLLQLTSML